MKNGFFYLLAVVLAAFAYLASPDMQGIIAALVAMMVCVVLPYLWKFLADKFKIGILFYGFLGFLVSGILVAHVVPLLSIFPLYVSVLLIAVLLTSGTFLFANYKQISKKESKEEEMPSLVETEVTRSSSEAEPKILDTSIIIDGRIIDLSSTGFVEGAFIVPNFVLREIQLISDSPDPIKRNRGRRGLDMLNQLQKRDDLEIRISYKDYSDTREVDAKLVRLARELGGKLVTNDFNLNKVAELQGVQVLNINNLANALKPVVLPGEELELMVVKEGKDENQGIGYLDDGTMVVIENGGKLMNKKVRVNVTSVIQTNAGKMIFTKVATR